MRKIITIVALLALTACTDPDGAVKAAEAQGLTNVQPQGYSFFGCKKDDDFATKFTATGANGQPVEGVACGGYFAGTTVRTF